MNRSNKIGLSDIYGLPDGQVHSKISFLKSLLNQSTNGKQFQEHLVKTTYTIKNIGIQGNQIGISSKRLQLKQKQKCQTSINPAINYYNTTFLPKNMFYSQPLTSIKRQEKSQHNKALDILSTTLANFGTNQSLQPQQYKSTFFKNNQSLKQLRKTKQLLSDINKQYRNQSSQANEKLFYKKNHSQSKQIQIRMITGKKSYASLLKQCNPQNNRFKEQKKYSTKKLIPLQHSQNPLFKRIIQIKSKVQNITLEDGKRKTKSTIFLGRYSVKSRNQFTSTRKLLKSRAKDLN